MDNVSAELWAYLSFSPLFCLAVTLLAYLLGTWMYRKSGSNPLCNPVAIAIASLVGFLWITDIPYPRYFDGAQFVHFLLGPTTVALAIPLYAHAPMIRRLFAPLLVALVAGSLTAILSAMALTRVLGGAAETVLSMAPKSATTPIAMGVAEKIGGIPSLTAVLVIMTGIIGAVTAGHLLRWLGIAHDGVKGFAIGVAAHGIGTARAFQISELAGAFAGLAIGLNGLLTALLTPLVVEFLEL